MPVTAISNGGCGIVNSGSKKDLAQDLGIYVCNPIRGEKHVQHEKTYEVSSKTL